ncbi:deoxyribose-phosphate aldolase [Companilactobacillus jidongensis]|uniref:deoxyribose-phosphate aldolase n=1 Tax=Companilactobacillus jidongensis TaxID=2486006 RepID=UPI000F766552|nr:deoxyribose-phosphate aldolase [Companilactobacillus jidongensis]
MQSHEPLNSFIDHTLLKPDATKTDVENMINEAKEYKFCSVMVNPFWVEYVSSQLKDTNVKTATVIGFPLGANTTTVKEFELENAIQNGADELDMVMNIGMFKAGNYTYVGNEIKTLARLAHGSKRILKVIIETSFLTDEEKAKAAEIVSNNGADFVKTSTGFSSKGASAHDVAILKKNVGPNTLVKASGGIHSYTEAMEMIKNGASRLGTSQSISIVNKK